MRDLSYWDRNTARFITATYTVQDRVDAKIPYRLHAQKTPAGIFFRELHMPFEDAHGLFSILFIFIPFIILILLGRDRLYLSFYDWLRQILNPVDMMFILFSLSICYFSCRWTKNKADTRYLFFRDNKLYIYGKQSGRRVYPIQDLQFRIMRQAYANDSTCNLEIYLPDDSLPEERRKVMIESTHLSETMDGVLNTLFPLLCGDDSNFNRAKRRPWTGLPFGYKLKFSVIFDGLWNSNSRYLLNYILFYLVHGSVKKVIAHEQFLISQARPQMTLGVEHG